jgi:hypothetical protein
MNIVKNLLNRRESRSSNGGGNGGRSECKKQKVVHPLAITDFLGGEGGY